MTKDEIIWKWWEKLRPYVADVMTRLTAEETRRAMYASIREGKGRTKQSISVKSKHR